MFKNKLHSLELGSVQKRWCQFVSALISPGARMVKWQRQSVIAGISGSNVS